MIPPNLVHVALAELDHNLLTSPDGKRIQVSLEAVSKLLSDPPPMVKPLSRIAIIEECALVVESHRGFGITVQEVAAAIRALKDKS